MRKRVLETIPAEKRLAEQWEALPAGAEVITTSGEQLRVLYPGRRGRQAGPDYVEAVLETPTGEVRGAVEVHRHTGDWLRHGHGSDPRYENVVLHVVGRDDGAAARTPGGTQLPLLEIGGSSHWGGEDPGRFPCATDATGETVGTVGTASENHAVALHLAGERRFQQVVDRLVQRVQAAALASEIEQVAYEEIAVALGYSRNSDPMRSLAEAAPLEAIRRQRADTGGPQLQAEALMLGAAGLLPSQRHLPARRGRDAYVEALERVWAAHGRPAALRAYMWDHGQVRPENGPVRRVVGLAHLALGWPDGGLLSAIREALLGPDRKPAAHRTLARLASVSCPPGYWLQHWDFGVAAKGALGGALDQRAGNETVALVGPSRAADIVVNVLLPLAVAVARPTRDGALEEAARSVYRLHPPLSENWITRLVRERSGFQVGAGEPVRTARGQQGLIAVYEATCHALACGVCVLGGGAESV